MKETNLEEVKRMAKTFLMITPEPAGKPDSIGALFVSHPILESRITYLPSTNTMFDIFTDKESFNKWKKEYSEFIDERNNVSSLFLCIRNPYKLIFFKYVNEYLSEKDYAEMLVDCWISSEYPSNDINVSQRDISKWFKIANKEYLMTESEKKHFDQLPKRFTIYRGVRDEKYCKGISWTTNQEKARWFSKRFAKNQSFLYAVEIDKESAFAYLNSRGEDEIIINRKALEKCSIRKIEETNLQTEIIEIKR